MLAPVDAVPIYPWDVARYPSTAEIGSQLLLPPEARDREHDAIGHRLQVYG